MINEKRLIFVLLFLLFLSVALQSLTGGWAILWNTLQYALVAAAFLAVLRYKVLLKPILADQYIDGKYVGQSVLPNNAEETIEEFTVSQTLLSTEISGKSKRNGTLVATWHGKLIDTRPKIYRFLLEVSMGGVETLGVLTLRIEDGAAEGFFQSLEAPHPKHQAVFTAILKEVYETRQSQWWIMEKLQKNNNTAPVQHNPAPVQKMMPPAHTPALEKPSENGVYNDKKEIPIVPETKPIEQPPTQVIETKTETEIKTEETDKKTEETPVVTGRNNNKGGRK